MTTVTVPLTEDPFKAHILDYISDDDYSDGDDDDDDHSIHDEDWADLEEEYEKKEDEDVAVFRAIVDHMPIESLLHLLQGHVRALQHRGKLETKVDVYDSNDTTTTTNNNNNNGKQQQQHQRQREEEDTADTKSQSQDFKEDGEEEEEEKQEEEAATAAMRIEKQFRWATEEDYTVKSDIHEIDPWKENSDLWFSGHELSAIKQDLVRQIRFFLMHHQERIETLDKVVSGDGPELVIEECIKELTRHSIGRGLEGHMSRLIQQTRKDHVRNVLNAQTSCNARRQSYDESVEILREHSLVYGQRMKLYSQRMAKSDEIEALTANMSRWEPAKSI
ncbi:unnamed protein product [Cylindrotheca closterium]|uniref:Uncharacterized protein n=1 Tax=Cylindrotheca closterium TaxID=2856 RepID=A0AAD2FZH8_9STRA|nr:unnamed protein product [Cylindrotheca closterium]